MKDVFDIENVKLSVQGKTLNADLSMRWDDPSKRIAVGYAVWVEWVKVPRVFGSFYITPDGLFTVNLRPSWNGTDEYFCTVKDMELPDTVLPGMFDSKLTVRNGSFEKYHSVDFDVFVGAAWAALVGKARQTDLQKYIIKFMKPFVVDISY